MHVSEKYHFVENISLLHSHAQRSSIKKELARLWTWSNNQKFFQLEFLRLPFFEAFDDETPEKQRDVSMIFQGEFICKTHTDDRFVAISRIITESQFSVQLLYCAIPTFRYYVCCFSECFLDQAQPHVLEIILLEKGTIKCCTVARVFAIATAVSAVRVEPFTRTFNERARRS